MYLNKKKTLIDKSEILILHVTTSKDFLASLKVKVKTQAYVDLPASHFILKVDCSSVA